MAIMYPIIKKYIIEKIDTGDFKEESMLPVEREFTEKFDVSRMTVRRAFDELIQDGVLIRKNGFGVIVAPQKQAKSSNKVSFKNDEQLIKKYGKITTKVVELKLVINHQLVNKYLNIDKDDEVYQLKRIQYGGNIPLVYENIFLPKKYFMNLFDIDCTQSMKDVVESTQRVVGVHRNSVEVEAVLASSIISKALQLPKGAIIMKMTNIVYNGDEAIYFGVDSIDGNRFKYVAND